MRRPRDDEKGEKGKQDDKMGKRGNKATRQGKGERRQQQKFCQKQFLELPWPYLVRQLEIVT